MTKKQEANATAHASAAPRRQVRPLPRRVSKESRESTAKVGVADSAGEGAVDTQFVESVARATAILTAFRVEDGPMGNTELAERTGLPKPTVSRLTYTLARCGLLSFNARFRVYELGPSIHALGHVAARSSGVRQVARPLMQQLALQANFNVGLGSRGGPTMVYLEAFEGEAIVGLRLQSGSRLPILTSAMGRAYLCGLEEIEYQAVLAELKPSYEGNWTELISELRRSQADFQRLGFCISAGDWRQDINGVAAPVRSPADGRVYAVNLGGPAYLLPKKRLLDELGPKIVELARCIEQAVPSSAMPVPFSTSRP